MCLGFFATMFSKIAQNILYVVCPHHSFYVPLKKRKAHTLFETVCVEAMSHFAQLTLPQPVFLIALWSQSLF